ncbi:MAG: hypothetical protein R3B09_04525 [Nannocystaceae bacterium]
MRTPLLVLTLLAPLVGCVDAPLTPAHLDADGQLRGVPMEQGAFAAQPKGTSHSAIQMTAVLATQAEGPLADAASFASDVGSVYLHLRADRLATTRPVTFVWTHGELRVEQDGVLAPTTALTMAASRMIEPSEVGPWKVEVLGEEAADGSRPTLFEREFQVVSAPPL